jgi:hypothetical protein
MWRIFSVASLAVAAGMAMWPARGTRQVAPPPPAKRHLIEVMRYGRNLICHDRFENNVVGNGNNTLGLARVEAMNSKSRGSSK